MPKKERLIVEERIEKFAHDPLCESMNKSYTNQFAVSGWVLSKPKIFVTANNLKGVGFIVYQINYRNDGETVYYSTFGIVSYNTDVVAQLEKEEKTFFVCVTGVNIFNRKKAKMDMRAMKVEITHHSRHDLLPNGQTAVEE
jgi:hypothetical protein